MSAVFYRKPPDIESVRRSRLQLSDFSGGMSGRLHENILPQRYASESYNFEFKDGALKAMRGITAFCPGGDTPASVTGETVLRVYHYRRFDRDTMQPDDRLAVYTQSKKLYGMSAIAPSVPVLLSEEFETPPRAVNYRLSGEDVLVLSGGGYTAVWDGKNALEHVPGAPDITSMCVHYERIFASGGGDRSAVWFSDDLDVTNWNVSLDEAGFLELADDGGGLVRVVHFLDYVYVFRSYGIARLTAYAEQTQFALTRLYTATGRIYPDTIAVCGDRIMFLAADGLYSFNGVTVSRAAKNLDGILQPESGNPCACAHSGEYALAARLKFKTGYPGEEGAKNNALVLYNPSDGRTEVLRGADISGLLAYLQESGSELLLSLRGKSKVYRLGGRGSIDGQQMHMLWRTPRTNLGRPDAVKSVKQLYMGLSGGCTVNVSGEVCGAKAQIQGSGGPVRRRLRARGTEFWLEFCSTDPDIEISRPELVTEYI